MDAVWLAKLAERGMLRPSFVPPPWQRELRDLCRYRRTLIRERTREKQRAEKLLLRHEALLLPDGGERPSISPAVVAAG